MPTCWEIGIRIPQLYWPRCFLLPLSSADEVMQKFPVALNLIWITSLGASWFHPSPLFHQRRQNSALSRKLFLDVYLLKVMSSPPRPRPSVVICTLSIMLTSSMCVDHGAACRLGGTPSSHIVGFSELFKDKNWTLSCVRLSQCQHWGECGIVFILFAGDYNSWRGSARPWLGGWDTSK